MKKKVGQKIIIFFCLILIFTQIFHPLNTEATAKLNWEAPNSGRNPYKFKLSDYLNANMVMQVVSCTGVVEKFVYISSGILSGNFKGIKNGIENYRQKIFDNLCKAAALGSTTALAALPGLTLSSTPAEVAAYCDEKKTTDKVATDELKEQTKLLEQEKAKQCLDGIAYNLARNQLVAMTKQTMNWINTGFSGDPMYVRNMNNFVTSIENQILFAQLDILKDIEDKYNLTDYPYAKSFARTALSSRQAELNFKEASKQNLTNYLMDGASIENFKNDFSKGGWSGWLALTQRPQNNPLGDTMIRSQKIADEQEKEVQNIKDEQVFHGFMSQKKCLKWKPDIERTTIVDGEPVPEIIKTDTTDFKNCLESEIVTPGSLIKDKVTNYLNSAERQLEMVDDINKVLYTLFDNLIKKLRLDGLSSLSTPVGDFTNVSVGWGSNNINWASQVDTKGKPFFGSSFDENRPFDLTKDLGNIYNRDSLKNLGGWNAEKNETTSGLALIPGKGEKNSYYTVTIKGETVLIKDGYNVWEKDDRAFFDGESWQNWKKGTSSPILKRGIIQIQQDYLVASKELLKITPAVMPALGELDYCIPGPNPNWQANSADYLEKFVEYISDLTVEYSEGGFLSKDSALIIPPYLSGAGKSHSPYRNYLGLFKGTNLWPKVLQTDIHKELMSLGRGLPYRGQKEILQAHTIVQSFIQRVFNDLTSFNEQYPIKINSIYSTLQRKYNEREDTHIRTENRQYLPMAQEGLTLTKKMIFYNDEIADKTKDLREEINQTYVTINKLELIKDEVGLIIKEAQGRRLTKQKEDIVEWIMKNNNFSKSQAEDAYQTCLREEDVNYLDYERIIVLTETGRCNDGIDNDFDGLIDAEDPDCFDFYQKDQTGTPKRKTSGGEDYFGGYISDYYGIESLYYYDY